MSKIKNEYKNTKLGLIPKEWQILKVSDFISSLEGGFSCNCENIPAKKNEVGILKTSAISGSEVLIQQNKKVLAKEISKVKRSLKSKSILIIRKNTPELVGRIAYVDKDYDNLYLPDLIWQTEYKTNIPMNKKWLFYILSSNKYRKKISNLASGTSKSMVNIRKNDVLNLKIPYPPINEQDKIVEGISLYDKGIKLQKKLIELKEIQKKGIIQKLFKQEIRFRDSKGNFFPEWEDKKLSEILIERSEYSTKSGKYEHLSLTKDGVVSKSERYERDFLVKDQEKKYKITKINDICYNPANLKFGVISRNKNKPGIFSPIYVTFEVKSDFNSSYLEHFLKRTEFINTIRKYEEGTVYERMAVKPKDFLLYSCKFPLLSEQNRISDFLDNLDIEIDLLKKEVEKLEIQKEVLLEKLLFGKVRVKKG